MRVIKPTQSGGVSLFVVIFAMLMFTIIAVGFVRLMVEDHNQASATSLSQAADDAANTGVEDGKRAILTYLATPCASTDNTSDACGTFNTTADDTCNAAVTSMGVATPVNGEVSIANTDYNEAYTCVQVHMATDDYVGQLAENDMTLIPLDTGSTPFNSVQISWHSSIDQGSSTTSLPSAAASSFPLMSDWATKNYPALLEAQVTQVPRTAAFSLGDLESPSPDANTVLLYPNSSLNTLITAPLSDDPSGNPSGVKCDTSNLATGGYACVATFSVASPTSGSATNRYALLRLNAFYAGTHFQVKALDTSGNPVPLQGVEPEIDSTGRAGDLFKRVDARVELTSIGFQYPQAAVDTTGDFCKIFSVTNNTSEYEAGTGCTP